MHFCLYQMCYEEIMSILCKIWNSDAISFKKYYILFHKWIVQLVKINGKQFFQLFWDANKKCFRGLWQQIEDKLNKICRLAVKYKVQVEIRLINK